MALKDYVHFFGGVDPAPSESQRSDDGTIVIGAATPREEPKPNEPLSSNEADWYFDLVYGRRFTWMEKLSARQWSAHLHVLHQRFRFTRICMDPGGGGTMVKRELIAPRQLIGGVETDVTPIADFVDGPTLVARGDFILHLFKRGDPGIEALWPELPRDDLLNDNAYSMVRMALEGGAWGLPIPVGEWMLDRREAADLSTETGGNGETGTEPGALKGGIWSEERVWALKCLDALGVQLTKILLVTHPDGTVAFTKSNARQFTAQGKKDFVSAAMYAYLAFRMWLRSEDFAWTAPEDEAAFSGTVVARR